MGIKIKYSPSAAAIGGTAYTIGRGQRIERDIRLAADVSLRQQSLSLQAERIASTDRYYRDRNERREEELGFRKQQQQEVMGLKLQEQLDAKRRIDAENTVIEYSPEQIRELDRINVGRNNARKDFADKKITAVEEEDFQRQFDRRQALVIPNTRLLTEKTPRQRLEDTLVIRKGIEYQEQANGDWKKTGWTLKERGDLWTKIRKSSQTTDPISGDDTTNIEQVWEEYEDFMTRITREDALPGQVEEMEKREAERQQALQVTAEQEAITEQATMDRDVASLTIWFEENIEGPLIGRIGGGKRRLTKDDVYGEKTYNKLLLAAVKKYPKIRPEDIKAELDKWWLARYEEHKGKWTQTHQNPEEFKGAARKAPPAPAAEDQVSVLAKELEKSLNLSPEAALRVAKKKLAYEEAAAQEKPETPEELGDVPQPKTKAEYDKLKPGTRYIDPDGVERIKR